LHIDFPASADHNPHPCSSVYASFKLGQFEKQLDGKRGLGAAAQPRGVENDRSQGGSRTLRIALPFTPYPLRITRFYFIINQKRRIIMTRDMRFAVSGAVAFTVMWIILSFQLDGLQLYIGIAGGLAFFIAAMFLIRIKNRG
jgi:hypothetical protein